MQRSLARVYSTRFTAPAARRSTPRPPECTINAAKVATEAATSDQWWMIEMAIEGVADFKRQFADAIRAHGMPQGAALFYSGGFRPCTILFVSPGAVKITETLLMAHGGKPCEKPVHGIFLDGHCKDPALLKSPYEA